MKIIRKLIAQQIRKRGLVKFDQRLIQKPIDVSHVEILHDSQFQRSVDEVRNLTLLDTERLANLWMLCRKSNPCGAIIEVGSFRGGSAMHLSNSSPDRKIFVCDTFESFGSLKIDRELDGLFHKDQFLDVRFDEVKMYWAEKGREVEFVKGYFPESALGIDISGVSFAHIDLDLYQSTLDTLNFLRTKFIEHSIIVFDDYFRKAHGVMRAIEEFEQKCPDWKTFPIYPAQGLMLHRSWFE
jgi:hypothetical protein